MTFLKRSTIYLHRSLCTAALPETVRSMAVYLAGFRTAAAGAIIAVLTVCIPISAYAAPATTSIVLAVTSNGAAATTATPQSVVILTATVVNAGRTAVTRGLVKFCDAAAIYCMDEHLLGKAQLTSAGTAIFKFIPAIGKHSYKAVFVGTGNAAASMSPAATFTVSGITTISSSGVPGNYSLLATVTSGVSAPTGNISFQDTTNGNYSIGSSPIIGTTLPTLVPGNAIGISDNPQSVVVADFNGDGIPDVATVSYTDYSVEIFLGNGDGTFMLKWSTRVAMGPTSIAAGDFNEDGIPDLAIANSASNNISVLLGAGSGLFEHTPPIYIGMSPTAITVEDITGDGVPDIIVANRYSNAVIVLACTAAYGTVNFAPVVQLAVGDGPTSVVVADFNGDGIADLATANTDDNSVTVIPGKGQTAFNAGVSYPVGIYPSSLATGDFNGDGIPDLVVTNSNQQTPNPVDHDTVTVMLGKGNGVFTSSTVEVNPTPIAVAVGDFDNDGIADLIVTTYENLTTSLLRGKGDGSFKTAIPYTVGRGPTAIAIGDFNGDGISDFTVVNQLDSTLSIWLSQITGTVTATLNNISIPGNGPHLLDAIYEGDNLYGSSIPSNTVSLSGTEIATALTLTSSRSTSNFGDQIVLTGQLTPYSAGNISTNAQKITFLSNGSRIGAGVLVSGVATLNVTSLPIGTDSLTAVYGGDDNFLTSIAAPVQIVVSAAGPTITPTLTFTPIADVVNGVTPFSVVATSASTGAVTYAVTSGPATISGSTVTISGVGTVVLSANQAASGNYTAAAATTSFHVTAPSTQDFSLTAPQTQSQTIRQGGGATYTLQLAPTGSTYPNTVSFTASGLPSGATYNFSPSTVAANRGPVAVNFTVQTPSYTVSSRGLRGFASVALALLLLPLTGARRMRQFGQKNRHAVALYLPIFLLTLGGLSVLTGCGGSGGSNSGSQSKSYPIIVTATSGSASHTNTLTLIVD